MWAEKLPNGPSANLVPRASVAFPQKASRPADISCDAVHLEQEHKWP